MTMLLVASFVVNAVVAGVAYERGRRAGHRQGWYRGYAARMHERVEGENYR